VAQQSCFAGPVPAGNNDKVTLLNGEIDRFDPHGAI
jgi:hypothetical protein